VTVGGIGVVFGGTRVSVGGTGVLVGGTGVSVGGTGVLVGGTGVSVGGTGVDVAVGSGVSVRSGVGDASVDCVVWVASMTACIAASASAVAAVPACTVALRSAVGLGGTEVGVGVSCAVVQAEMITAVNSIARIALTVLVLIVLSSFSLRSHYDGSNFLDCLLLDEKRYDTC
jgi:hypothetical protein